MGSGLIEKIFQTHILTGTIHPGEEIGITIDQVILQDHNGTQTLLDFEAMGGNRVACHLAVCYVDHNVLSVRSENMEDHLYLQDAASKYGLWFAKAGTGICHQVHTERFAVPATTLLATDSHALQCGGVGMLGFGAGALEVATILRGEPYFLRVPSVFNVRLKGHLRPWCHPKDITLELLRRLSVTGGRGKAFEFTGEGIHNLSTQQRTAVTNGCTELGATTALFPSDSQTRDFFRWAGRESDHLNTLPDRDADYSEVMELNLSEIEPLIAMPSQPDQVVPVREVEGTKIEQVMVGGCASGSYEELKIAAALLRGNRVDTCVRLLIQPSSRAALELIASEGELTEIVSSGAEITPPMCGACIGVGYVPAPGTKSLRTVGRNFAGRSGLKEDSVFLCSPQTALVSATRGVITDPREIWNGISDKPQPEYSVAELAHYEPGLIPPASRQNADTISVRHGQNIVSPCSSGELSGPIKARVLLKLGDNVSTDGIMPASVDSLAYRSNIPAISRFTFSRIDPSFVDRAVDNDAGWIVAGMNYGQGSSREHAAAAISYLGIKGILAKSFARIHYANLINFGVLPLVFANPHDYDELDQESGDILSIEDARAALDCPRVVLKNETWGRSYEMCLELTGHQRHILRAGGLLSYVIRQPLSKQKYTR